MQSTGFGFVLCEIENDLISDLSSDFFIDLVAESETSTL